MMFPRLAKFLGFTASEDFETKDGAVMLSLEQMKKLEANDAAHAIEAQAWKDEKAKMETEHTNALSAEKEKTTAANAKVGELTTDLAKANARIKELEDEPADKKDPAQTGQEGSSGKPNDTQFAYSAEKFKKRIK